MKRQTLEDTIASFELVAGARSAGAHRAAVVEAFGAIGSLFAELDVHRHPAVREQLVGLYERCITLLAASAPGNVAPIREALTLLEAQRPAVPRAPSASLRAA